MISIANGFLVDRYILSTGSVAMRYRVVEFFSNIGRAMGQACKRAGVALVFIVTFGRINWFKKKKKNSSQQILPLSTPENAKQDRSAMLPNDVVPTSHGQKKSSGKDKASPLLKVSSPKLIIKRIDFHNGSDSDYENVGLPPLLLPPALKGFVKTTSSRLRTICKGVDELRCGEENIMLTPTQKIKLRKKAEKKFHDGNEEINDIKTEISQLFIQKRVFSEALQEIIPVEKALIKQRNAIQLLKQTLQEFYENHASNNALEQNEILKSEIKRLAKEYDRLIKKYNKKSQKQSQSVCHIINSVDISCKQIEEKIRDLQAIENDLSQNKIGNIQPQSSFLTDTIDQKRQLIIEQQEKIRNITDDCAAQVVKVINACDELNAKIGQTVTTILGYIELIKTLEKGILQDDLDTVTQSVDAFELLYKAYQNPDSVEKQLDIQRMVDEKIDVINIVQENVCLKKNRLIFMENIITYFRSAFPEENNFQRIEIDERILRHIIYEATSLRQSINKHDDIKDGIVDQNDIAFKEYLDGFMKAVNDKNTPRSSSFFPFTHCEHEMRKILFKFLGKNSIIDSLGKKHPAVQMGRQSFSKTNFPFLSRSLPETLPQENSSSSEIHNSRKSVLPRNHTFSTTCVSAPSMQMRELTRRLSNDLSSHRGRFSPEISVEKESLEQPNQAI